MGKVGKNVDANVGTRRFISKACLGSLGKHDREWRQCGKWAVMLYSIQLFRSPLAKTDLDHIKGQTTAQLLDSH